MKHLALILMFAPLQAFAGSFMFTDVVPGPAVTPPSPTRETPRTNVLPVEPSEPSGPRRMLPGQDTPTEAGLECPTGTCAGPKKPVFTRIDVSKIAGATPPAPRASNNTGNACLRNLILQSAKNVVRRVYGNRPYSAGWCATGVRTILNASGTMFSPGLGDAVTWHTRGRLKALGFENIINKGYTAANAPPGAVLVFRGPATDMSSPTGGLPRKRYRRGRGAGTWVGHVSIKGERPDRYYTDGRTEDPAVAGRTLVGIYVPVKCVNCRGAAARCEGAQ